MTDTATRPNRYVNFDPNAPVFCVYTEEFGVEHQLFTDRFAANSHALQLQTMNAYKGYQVIVAELLTVELTDPLAPVNLA